MPHTEYEDLVDKACEANERSCDNEIELREMHDKLKKLVARMDAQDQSMDLMREKIELLNEDAKQRIAFIKRVDRYLRECCGQTDDDQRVWHVS